MATYSAAITRTVAQESVDVSGGYSFAINANGSGVTRIRYWGHSKSGQTTHSYSGQMQVFDSLFGVWRGLDSLWSHSGSFFGQDMNNSFNVPIGNFNAWSSGNGGATPNIIWDPSSATYEVEAISSNNGPSFSLSGGVQNEVVMYPNMRILVSGSMGGGSARHFWIRLNEV